MCTLSLLTANQLDRWSDPFCNLQGWWSSFCKHPFLQYFSFTFLSPVRDYRLVSADDSLNLDICKYTDLPFSTVTGGQMFDNVHAIHFYERPDVKSSTELKEILLLASLFIIYKNLLNMSTRTSFEVPYL